jgi:hypothetical protein
MADKKISALTGAATPLAGSEVLPIVQSGATVKVSVDNLTAGKTVNASGLQIGSIGATSAAFPGRIKLEDGPVSLQGPGGLEFVTATFGSGYGWKISSIDSAGAQLLFGYRQNSVDWTESMRLTSDGNLKISTAAKGIDFSANTHAAGMTSELLNDYEEGTHVATITCETSGTVTLNSSFETLAYTKVGRQVTVTGFMLVSSVSLPTGYFTISLPFTISNILTQQSARCAGTIIVGGSVSSVANGFIAYGLPNEALFRVYMANSNTAIGNTSAQQLQANTEIFIQFTYFV